MFAICGSSGNKEYLCHANEPRDESRYEETYTVNTCVLRRARCLLCCFSIRLVHFLLGCLQVTSDNVLIDHLLLHQRDENVSHK
ncbi:hypothetical protein V5799_016497 [Amblyomma americanum]|uniref:Uncharacterized protein n=1 Tax=Amblyomma americanum TaxID=6943 RepID=A0AAQ4F5L7_AMBAM